MRIAFTTKNYFPMLGGSLVFAAMLAKAFSRKGHEVRLLTRMPGKCTGKENGFEVVREPSWKLLSATADWADVLIQVDASWKDALPFFLKGVPWFPTIHRGKAPYSCLDGKGRLLLAIESMGYRLGKSIGVAHYVMNSWNLNNEPIPNPYDDQFFYFPAASTPRDIDVLYVGRVSRDKGVFVLLEALKLVSLSLPQEQPLKVAYVGVGVDLLELKNTPQATTDFELVTPGMLSPREVGNWMRRSKVLAFPTTPAWLEASPLTVIEAVACGCKVVASDIGGTKENIGPEGALVPPGDVEKLAAAIVTALRAGNPPISPEVSDFLSSRKLDTVADKYLARFQQSLSIQK